MREPLWINGKQVTAAEFMGEFNRGLERRTRERDEARAAPREYRAGLLDSSPRYGDYRRGLDEEFAARFSWLEDPSDGG